MSTGVELIQQERSRQIDEEGWTPEHDDGHDKFEMTEAAICYANRACLLGYKVYSNSLPSRWPSTWPAGWWKPEPRLLLKRPLEITLQDSKRMLVKAGALIAAEIDRLTRLEEKQ